MRYYDRGEYFRVTLSVSDVFRFADDWPGFGPLRPLAFEFAKANGDLVDVVGNTSGMDGLGLLALSQDARTWGRTRCDAKAAP
jgi:hypothetical protein